MRILITGNMGYVGAAVVRDLRERIPGAELIGFDNAYFAHNLTATDRLPEAYLNVQHFGDVRDFPPPLLDGVDAVIHLAAVSNDPMGNRFEQVTEEINFKASVRLAEHAVKRGVGHFAFASSCSVYGAAGAAARSEKDDVNPLTAYARSKIATESALVGLARGDMLVTSLRFATACGMSDRLRLDLVLNDFVAGAVANGEITVLSDGTPWRPLIDVQDMARALRWAITRSASNGGAFVVLNVGSDRWNFQVKDLADAVGAAVPGTKVRVNDKAPPDRRSYRVDFGLFKRLAPEHLPNRTLGDAISALRDGLVSMGFRDPEFRNSSFMRLKALEQHIATGRMLPNLRWNSGGRA
jgi:nucleoside-diphosphate-sugar epimerase